VLIKENVQLTDKGRTNSSDRGKAKYKFFTKQWSLIIFQNAELVARDAVAAKAAQAAVKLQCIGENYKRVYVFSRAFLQLTPWQQMELFPKNKDDKPDKDDKSDKDDKPNQDDKPNKDGQPDEDEEPDDNPELAKRKQIADTDEACVTKKPKTSSQPTMMHDKTAKKSAQRPTHRVKQTARKSSTFKSALSGVRLSAHKAREPSTTSSDKDKIATQRNR